MGNEREPESRFPFILTAAVMAALFALYFGYSFTNKPPFWTLDPSDNAHFTILYYFVDRAFWVLAAGGVAFAAWSAGLFFVGRMRLHTLPPAEEAVLAFGIGLGGISLLTLAFGLAGFLNFGVALVIVALFAALGTRRMTHFFRRVKAAPRHPWALSEKLLAGLGLAGAALILVYSFDPPMDFDVLEYHLGAPAYWFSLGSVRYIEYNVYSNFPSNAEMLYLFSMALSGSKLAGALLGKVLNAYVAFAAAGAAYSLGRWMHSRGAGVFAAAALLTGAGFFHVATGGYVEPLQALYTVLAVLLVGRCLEHGGLEFVVPAGLAAGFAMGVKYPAAPFVAVPLALVLLLRRGGAREKAAAFAAFSLAALAVSLPWYIKNMALTGNPFYPLLYGVFGGRDWSPVQDARWVYAHSPKGGLAWEQWARHFFGTFFGNEMVSFLAFGFVPLVFVARAATRRVGYVLGYAALYVFLWLAITHRIDRFLLPGLAVLGAVSGAGLYSLKDRASRALAAAAAVGFAGLNVFYLAAVYGVAPGITPAVPLFGQYEQFLDEKLPGYSAWQYLNANVPPGQKVMLWGAAETFYLDASYGRTTVFDRKPLEEMAESAGGDPAATASALRAAGVSYVFADWATWRRQQETYEFPYGGVMRPGYSAVVTPAFFNAMAQTGIIKPVYTGGGEVYPGTPAYVLYKVD